MTTTNPAQATEVLAERRAACRIGRGAAACTLAATLSSGPVALVIVRSTHPQSDWQSARVFAEHYHPIQSLPFFLGLFLVAGFVGMICSLHALAHPTARVPTQTAVVFASAFAALVLLNYALQTTFVPSLTKGYVDANGPLLEAVTMSNPKSIAWSLEMWGYAWLGVATWLASPVLSRNRLERATAYTFAVNGPISIAGALWTAFDPGWVMTKPGLVVFSAWNGLVVVMSALAFAAFRSRLNQNDGASEPTA
jgi:hypothetical protein